MRFILIFLLSLSFFVSSDDHSPEEKAVLAAHAKYYAARTEREDFATMVSMESKSGVYETYSDGSFHKPARTWSLEVMKITSQSEQAIFILLRQIKSLKMFIM